MADGPVRYVSADEDSGRWIGLICALLIFQTPDMAAPLGRYSPWLDRVIYPRDEVFARLAGQQHRRFIKTHTPLDGIPLDSRATYLVTARHPLDVAVSLYHQIGNIDRSWQRQHDGRPAPAEPEPERKPLREWLLDWIDRDADPRQEMDSLPGVMWHLSDAWARRGEPNVVLIHYDDLSCDLGGQMRRLAARLGITAPEEAWPGLVEAATFGHMQANAGKIVGTSRILKSSTAFFRRGTSGAGREILTDQQIAHYHARASQLAPKDMLTWLHAQAGPAQADQGRSL